jgi:hypothetical protein
MVGCQQAPKQLVQGVIHGARVVLGVKQEGAGGRSEKPLTGGGDVLGASAAEGMIGGVEEGGGGCRGASTTRAQGSTAGTQVPWGGGAQMLHSVRKRDQVAVFITFL